MDGHTPVQLPARIGPQLVEACVQRIMQCKRPHTLPILDAYCLSFHQIAVIVQQLHVQHTADVRGLMSVGPHDVCLIV